MDLTGDDHLERAVTELGEPEALFRISRGRLLAKLSLGLMLLACGTAANYLWWVEGPGRPEHLVLIFLIGLPISGVSLLLHMYRNRGLFVLIYHTGMLRLRRGEVDSIPWSEIDHLRLRLQRAEGAMYTRGNDGSPLECWLPVDVPTFKLWDAGLTVARDDGVEVHLGPALTDYDILAEEVQKRTFAALWPALRDRFRNGDRITFGELEAGPTGMRHAGKYLSWREVKEITIAQGKLSIKQAGKWLPWALLDMSSLPNPHLLFALSEEAIRIHRPIPTEPQQQEMEQHGQDDWYSAGPRP